MARRPIKVITKEIRENWEKPYFGAVPYLDAMATMGDITEDYLADSGASVVMYFLSNATTWRGDAARVIKAELKGQLREIGHK